RAPHLQRLPARGALAPLPPDAQTPRRGGGGRRRCAAAALSARLLPIGPLLGLARPRALPRVALARARRPPPCRRGTRVPLGADPSDRSPAGAGDLDPVVAAAPPESLLHRVALGASRGRSAGARHGRVPRVLRQGLRRSARAVPSPGDVAR